MPLRRQFFGIGIAWRSCPGQFDECHDPPAGTVELADDEALLLDVAEKTLRTAQRVRAVGAGNRCIARARPPLLGGTGNHHEDSLHILRQDGSAHRDILPRVILRHIGREPGPSVRQHAAEFIQVRHGRTEAFDSAADHEFLIEDADRAESCVWLGQNGAQDTVQALAPLGQLLSARWLLHCFRMDVDRR